MLDYYNITGTTEEQAALLLQYLMTYIHSCTSVEELINLGPLIPLATPPVQVADVAVTRQWKLAQLMAARADSDVHEADHLHEMAAATLASLASLTDREKGIVGVGKIAAIVQVLIDRASGVDNNGHDLINHLVTLVSWLDVENQYLPPLRLAITSITPFSKLTYSLPTMLGGRYPPPSPHSLTSQNQLHLLSEFEDLERLLRQASAADQQRIELLADGELAGEEDFAQDVFHNNLEGS